MTRIKCRSCGLVYVSTDIICRRCGSETGNRNGLTNSPKGPREAAKKSSWLYTLLFLSVFVLVADYLYTGVKKSFEEVGLGEPASLTRPQSTMPNVARTRNDEEQRRAGQYGNAIQKSSGLAESQKHSDEVNKLIQPDKDKTKN